MRVRNREHLEKVRAFAEQAGMIDQLREQFDTLERIAANMGGELELGYDFAPQSFNWSVIKPNGDCAYHGGLIFHGDHDNGGDGGFPTLSVSLGLCCGWQIHS